MSRKDMIKNISNKTGFSREICESVLDAFTEEITDSLVCGDRVALPGLMTLVISERKERKGRHPKTGEIVTFPSVKSVKCKMSRGILDAINER